jgi:hypothetical protein
MDELQANGHTKVVVKGSDKLRAEAVVWLEMPDIGPRIR